MRQALAYLVQDALHGLARLLVARVLQRRHSAVIDEVNGRIQLGQSRLQGAHVLVGDRLEDLLLQIGQLSRAGRSGGGRHGVCVVSWMLWRVEAGDWEQ